MAAVRDYLGELMASTDAAMCVLEKESGIGPMQIMHNPTRYGMAWRAAMIEMMVVSKLIQATRPRRKQT